MVNENETLEQQWFWDHHFLRNRNEPLKVLTMSRNTGYLTLHDLLPARKRSQQFELEGREIVCKEGDLRISFYPGNLAVACVNPDRNKEAHPWEIIPGMDINS